MIIKTILAALALALALARAIALAGTAQAANSTVNGLPDWATKALEKID